MNNTKHNRLNKDKAKYLKDKVIPVITDFKATAFIICLVVGVMGVKAMVTPAAS